MLKNNAELNELFSFHQNVTFFIEIIENIYNTVEIYCVVHKNI